MDDCRLHAVHLVQPDHRPAVHRLRAQRSPRPRRPIRNLDTFDPERKNSYESFNFEGSVAHPRRRPDPRRPRLRARAAQVNCTAPDDPNYLTATANVFNGAGALRRLRARHSVAPASEDVGHQGSRLRHQRQHLVPEQLQPDQLAADDRDARHHALSGQLPGAVPGRPDHHADRRLRPDVDELHARIAARHRRSSASSSSTSRSRARSASAASQVLPTFEVFNVNNSDAIISYITTNVLSTSYLAPNSIMQGRMYRLRCVTRW